MARGAARGSRAAPAAPPPRKGKQETPKSGEDLLFFNRLRNHAKWVFLFLAVAFALTFVLFGVGSNIGGGLTDVLNGISGDSSNRPSVSKALAATEKRPKDPVAWRELATAYELNGANEEAAAAWARFTVLRPKSTEGLSHQAALLEGKVQQQTDQARNAQIAGQIIDTSSFRPSSTTTLGRALATGVDPIEQARLTAANTLFNELRTRRETTLKQLVVVYQQLGKLQPKESTIQLQLATAAQNANDLAVAVAAYRRFLKLAPDDPSAPYAKQQLASLSAALTG